MKLFGTKVPEPTDEDRAAAARLSALAARLKPSSDLTEVAPDPLGEPQVAEEPEAALEPEAPAEPEASADSREPDSEE